MKPLDVTISYILFFLMKKESYIKMTYYLQGNFYPKENHKKKKKKKRHTNTKEEKK